MIWSWESFEWVNKRTVDLSPTLIGYLVVMPWSETGQMNLQKRVGPGLSSNTAEAVSEPRPTSEGSVPNRIFPGLTLFDEHLMPRYEGEK